MNHAVVTGGSRGIGRGVATAYLERGWKVTAISLAEDLAVDGPELLEIAGRWPGSGLRTVGLDVRDGPTLAAAIGAAEADFGPCTSLVTAAGVARPSRFLDLPAVEFRRQMEVNYFGTLNAVRAVWTGMCERRRGRIALVSSGAGLMGIYGHTAYAPTKFAVRGLAEALRSEGRPYGVSVSVCYLPDTDTQQYRANAAVRPAGTTAISAGGGLWSADDVGESVVEGLEKGKARIAPGLMALVLALASPMAPLLHRRFDKLVDRVEGEAHSR